jgi:Rod binding domain-containing protein
MQAGIQLPALDTTRTWHLAENRLARLQAAVQKRHPTSIEDDEPLRAQAAQQLASLFIFQLLQEMRKTIPKSGLFDGGRQQEMYEQMIDERLADGIAANGQFGIAPMVHQELLKYG